jgi:hypothetical protein
MAKSGTTGNTPPPDDRDEAFAYQLDFLKLEFGHINDAIGRLDETTAKVKNWAIVTWAGSVGLVLGQAQLHPMLWLTSILPLLFLFVDAWWRRIQRSFIFRSQTISQFLNGPALRESFKQRQLIGFVVLDPRAQQLSKSKEYRAFTSVFRTMRFKEVAVFYIGLSLVSLVLWWCLNFSFHLKPMRLPTK